MQNKPKDPENQSTPRKPTPRCSALKIFGILHPAETLRLKPNPPAQKKIYPIAKGRGNCNISHVTTRAICQPIIKWTMSNPAGSVDFQPRASQIPLVTLFQN